MRRCCSSSTAASVIDAMRSQESTRTRSKYVMHLRSAKCSPSNGTSSAIFAKSSLSLVSFRISRDERRDAVERAKRVRPALSPFLFCGRTGKGYIDEETGECHGFDSIWSRFMDRVLKETKVAERFTAHDLRAKVGSDAESLETRPGRCCSTRTQRPRCGFCDVSPRGCDVQGWRARRDSNPLPLGS